ncbi:copper-transporting ATPase [Hahella sp. CCB-MM4]|uniref:heavy metal translocating P-type ATPase n=1 Tax=Hahella sp. (strain CCB-MM4) TaxID=1926491 RepID=UPI000B9B9133|nr:heavy metal translocating P-type ATPase [Hahella sp. CCB-MM4]OZG73738.1 copper-transporting ATPase [Hahella sp. CCB-MM4]
MNDALRCFHCHNPVPSNVDIRIQVNGESKPVCCHGCEAVARLVMDGGLEQFYQFREGELEQPDTLSPEDEAKLSVFDRPDILNRLSGQLDQDKRRIQLSIEGITCAACVWLLEQFVRKLDGVDEFWVNLTTHRAELVWAPQKTRLSTILKAINSIGFNAFPYSASQEEKQLQEQQKKTLIRLGIAGIGMMQNMMLAIPSYFGLLEDTQQMIDLFRYISLLVALPVVLYSAQPFFSAALRDLKLRHLTMDVPVAIAIGIAYLSSAWITVFGGKEVYYDSVCMFTFFLLLGRYLESLARVTAARTNSTLQGKAPVFIYRLTGKEDDSVEMVPVDDLQVGDLIRLKPGDFIPVDGTIVQGSSKVNNAALTGEFIPQPCSEGGKVLSGSVNIENSITVRVDALDQDSHLSTINRLVDRALQDRPRLSTLADRIASFFVAGVLMTATVVGLVWWQIDPEHAFAVMLSVLVVTCPCALSLATPTALTVATTALRQSGFVLSRGHVLETLAKATHFVFDKTGTLTQGELTVASVDNLSGDANEALLAIAGALEWESPHPVAKAFRPFASGPAHNVTQYPGQGISGEVSGQVYRLGSAAFCQLDQKKEEPVDDPYQRIYLSRGQQLIAIFQLSDTLRTGALDAVKTLQERGLKVSMLTGDSSSHVESIAQSVGISNVSKSLTPEQKLDQARHWQQSGDTVVMVGDGINDVPAMAGSHLSIAMQNASDLTQIKADAVILNTDLNTLVFALEKARSTFRVIRQNLTWALVYNLIALPLAAAGYIAPWAAAIGMSVSSLIVVLNALRLSGSRK